MLTPRRIIIGKRTAIGIVAAVLLGGYLIPENPVIPVQGASARDWNHLSFWYSPWGKSGMHKGFDIFSPLGTPVVAST